MSAISRLLPASRRSYSSYFSSKPGGGRFFNSAKSSRSSVITGAARQTTPIKPSDAPESRDAGVNAKDHGENTAQPADAQTTNSNEPGSPSAPSAKAGEFGNASSPQTDSRAPITHSPHQAAAVTAYLSPLHPVVKPKDFKVVQFFSMHRPLLSLSDPPSIFSPSNNTFFAPQSSPFEDPLFTSDTSDLPAPPSNILSSVFNSSTVHPFDDFSEAFPEGDAETARQLTRALAMNKAGSMVEWEKTLRMLGLDPEMEPERIVMREQMEKEWEVMLDSTKRKRRKKMKKHKLKKRRRLTRATRLKIGR